MNSTKLETALLNLQYELLERGINIESIKVDSPLFIGGKPVHSIHGVGVKTSCDCGVRIEDGGISERKLVG